MRCTPLSIKIFGVLYAVWAINRVHQILTITSLNGVPRVFSSSEAFLLFGVPLVGSLLLLIGGTSLFFVSDWMHCFVLLLFNGGVFVTLSIVKLLVLGKEGSWWFWFELVMDVITSGLILWYFLRPSVKAQFQQTTSA